VRSHLRLVMNVVFSRRWPCALLPKVPTAVGHSTAHRGDVKEVGLVRGRKRMRRRKWRREEENKKKECEEENNNKKMEKGEGG
jgi:hypothetical protein